MRTGQRDNGEDWVKKPLWLEPSDKGRGDKRQGPQWSRIWVFTCTKGNRKRFKIGDDVIRFPLCKDPFFADVKRLILSRGRIPLVIHLRIHSINAT